MQSSLNVLFFFFPLFCSSLVLYRVNPVESNAITCTMYVSVCGSGTCCVHKWPHMNHSTHTHTHNLRPIWWSIYHISWVCMCVCVEASCFCFELFVGIAMLYIRFVFIVDLRVYLAWARVYISFIAESIFHNACNLPDILHNIISFHIDKMVFVLTLFSNAWYFKRRLFITIYPFHYGSL